MSGQEQSRRSPEPVPAPFIVGVGRSGTTLLRLMLDAHPDLAIPPETHFVPALIKAAEQSQGRKASLELIANAETWPNLGLDVTAVAEAFSSLCPFSPAEAVRTIFHLYARRHGKTRWGDKTPPYRAYMNEIALTLPEARFIHIIRDGRDVALSYKGLWFGPGDDFEAQARFWVAEIELARAQAARLPFYMEVKFEDLVIQPEVELQRICRFVNLRYDKVMLEYPRRAEQRLSEYVQGFGQGAVGQIPVERFRTIHDRTHASPDPDRIGRWRLEMTGRDIAKYVRIAGPMLRSLGYSANV